MKNTFCFLFLLFVVPATYGQQLIAMYMGEKENNAWTETSRTIYHYNPDESLAVQYAESLNGNGFWKAHSKFVYEYNSAGKLTVLTSSTLDQATQVWKNDRRKTITYNETNGKITGITHERYTANAWLNDSKEDLGYDAVSGFQDLTVTKIWEPVINDWKFYSKTENSYTGSGALTGSVYSNWDAANTAWILSERSTYTYTTFDSLAVTKEEKWENNNWKNFLLVSYTYNANEYKINQKNQGWNADNNSWHNVLNLDFTYNTDESLHQFIVQNWQETNSTWQDDSRFIYAYGTSFLATEEIPFTHLKISPNPAKDEVKIEFEQETNALISLTDLQGKLIQSETTSGLAHSVSINGLSPGIYLLKISHGKNEEVRRIVKY